MNDLETQNLNKARPYYISFYTLSKLAGKYTRDLTANETEKCRKDTLVLDGDNCITNALDFLLKFRGDERKVNKKIVEYNLQLHAHDGSSFDTWIILNNLPCDKSIVDIIKNGKVEIELKVLYGYISVNNKKQIPQYLYFRCGMSHLNY